MIVSERVSAETYQRIALSDPSRPWELHDGQLREKPGMSAEHNWLMSKLGYLLQRQLDWDDFHVRVNAGRVRHTAENYFIPDVWVVPTDLVRPLRGRSDLLEVYDVPLPLVVAIWSPSTGGYDIDAKLPAYLQRGDREIWRIHPYERTVTLWRRQSDTSYAEMIFHEGTVQPVALPNVMIDLALLLDDVPPEAHHAATTPDS